MLNLKVNDPLKYFSIHCAYLKIFNTNNEFCLSKNIYLSEVSTFSYLGNAMNEQCMSEHNNDSMNVPSLWYYSRYTCCKLFLILI